MKNINLKSILSISILIFLILITLIITLFFIKKKLSEKVENPTVSLDKVLKEEDGEQLRYTKVEYQKNKNSDKKTIYEFKDEINEENEVEYVISYLS